LDKKSDKIKKENLKNDMLNSHRQMETVNDSRYPLRLPSDNFEGGSPVIVDEQSP
jgi:hypothetical protein